MDFLKNPNASVKLESSEEFLARGGKVNTLNFIDPSEQKRRAYRSKKDIVEVTPADLAALPTALKIRYGIKV
jgi:hypothetical protein